MRKIAVSLWLVPRQMLMFLIDVYQRTLSPDHGFIKAFYPYGFCRHEPTCSAYGKIVLEKEGFMKGSILIVKRLLSCHPWKEPSKERLEKIALKNVLQ